MRVCMYVCMYVYMRLCMYVCMYVYIYVCITFKEQVLYYYYVRFMCVEMLLRLIILSSGSGGKQKVFMIGGAQEAGELDAKRAIDQGTRLAAVVETANTGDVFEAPIGLVPSILKFYANLMKK